MATSNDYPGLPYVQAKGYTRGRPDGPPLWIVWHDMEVDELPDRAENTAGYFANPGDGREVSSHYCADSDSIVQTVDEDDSAWTVGNRPGNNRGINFELAGRASQTRLQWLDAYGRAMFNVVAPVAARAMKRWRIPNRWCSIDDLRAFRPGHTTHNDLRVAFGGTTHTDPGPGFPTDHVLSVVGAALDEIGDNDMPDVYYRIVAKDPKWNGRVYVSNRVHRRGPLRGPGTIQSPATAGLTVVTLTDEMRTAAQDDETWDSYLTSVAGPAFPDIPAGEVASHTHPFTGNTSPGVNLTVGGAAATAADGE